MKKSPGTGGISMKLFGKKVPVSKMAIIGAGISLIARVLLRAERRRLLIVNQQAFFNWMDNQ